MGGYMLGGLACPFSLKLATRVCTGQNLCCVNSHEISEYRREREYPEGIHSGGGGTIVYLYPTRRIPIYTLRELMYMYLAQAQRGTEKTLILGQITDVTYILRLDWRF